ARGGSGRIQPGSQQSLFERREMSSRCNYNAPFALVQARPYVLCQRVLKKCISLVELNEVLTLGHFAPVPARSEIAGDTLTRGARGRVLRVIVLCPCQGSLLFQFLSICVSNLID